MIPSPASLPSRERFSGLLRFLRVAIAVTVVSAATGLLFDAAGVVMLAAVIAAPLVRVAWLGVRWYHRGDRRYGLTAAALLGVIAAAAAVALAV